MVLFLLTAAFLSEGACAAEIRDILPEPTGIEMYVLVNESQYVEAGRVLDAGQGYSLFIKDVSSDRSNKTWVEMSYKTSGAAGKERSAGSFVISEGDSFYCYRTPAGETPVLVMSAVFSKTYVRDESFLIEFYPFVVYTDPYVENDTEENMKWTVVQSGGHGSPGTSAPPSPSGAADNVLFSIPAFSFFSAAAVLFAAALLLRKDA